MNGFDWCQLDMDNFIYTSFVGGGGCSRTSFLLLIHMHGLKLWITSYISIYCIIKIPTSLSTNKMM